MDTQISETPERRKRAKLFVIAGVVAILIVALVAYLLFFRQKMTVAVNHLIPGVPAYTLYNTYMDMEPTYIDAAKSVLDYWGHTTIPLSEIKHIYGTVGLKPARMNLFFQERGYQTEFFDASSKGYSYDALFDKMKSYVQKDIPVIVLQQRTTSGNDIADGYRVVIGMSDTKKIVTVHDYQYGNNYEISYDNFRKMSELTDGGASMLAIWPGDILKQRLQPVDRTKPYPARIDTMQRLGDLWEIRANALEYGYRGDMPKSIELLKGMVVQDDFKNLLPSAYQYGVYDCLVRRLFAVNKPAEAIDFITNKMEPIDHDLNASFGIWTGQIDLFKRVPYTTTDKLASHYFWLGLAYDLVGKQDDAKKAFQDGITTEPEYYTLIIKPHKAIMPLVLKSMKALKIID